MPVNFYDSIGDFLRAIPAVPGCLPNGGRDKSSGMNWDGGQSYVVARNNLSIGRPETFSKADRLLEQLEDAGIEVETPILDTGRAGFIPCVPAFIAGSPDSMFRIEETPMDSTPIKIMVGIGYSASITTEKARNRGIAMLALARKLGMIRPVELWVFDDCHGKDKKDGTGNCAIPVIRIETSPLDMATASYALTDVAFSRQLCFEWCAQRGFDGRWAWGIYPNDPAYHKRLREVLKAGPDDIVLPGGFALDQLLDRPLEWVNNEVKKFLTVREKELAAS